MADLMVSEGYLAAGYEYIVIDDCWSEFTRDANDELQPNHERFPSGMLALSNYVSKQILFDKYFYVRHRYTAWA